jgi:hypothetical protein
MCSERKRGASRWRDVGRGYGLAIALALGLAAPIESVAEVVECRTRDYGELDAMPRAELLKLRCAYAAQMYAQPRDTTNASGQVLGARRFAYGERCATELSRMDALLARKYSVDAATGGRQRAIDAMCRNPPSD